MDCTSIADVIFCNEEKVQISYRICTVSKVALGCEYIFRAIADIVIYFQSLAGDFRL